MEEYLGSAILSSKNQVRLPNSVIEHLELNSSDIILFVKKSNDVILKKGRVVPDEQKSV